MARPNIWTVSPSSGITGGRTLVEVTGSNFQLTPAPPAAPTGVLEAWNPTVEVLFGTALGTSVQVLSEGRLYVLSPASPLGWDSPEGAVDVTVRNIDQDGNVIAGETTTKSSAYTYTRPNVNTEDDLTRVCRQIIREMKRQLLHNVRWLPSTDWTDDPGALNLSYVSEVPAVVLAGPDIPENRFYSSNVQRTDDQGGGEHHGLLPPYTVDLEFMVSVVADGNVQSLNLLKHAQAFFHRNKLLQVPRDGSAPSGEQVEYEMEMLQPFTISATANESNIRAFSGRFVVRGFDIDDPTMATTVTKELDTIALSLDADGDGDGFIGGVVQYIP